MQKYQFQSPVNITGNVYPAAAVGNIFGAKSGEPVITGGGLFTRSFPCSRLGGGHEQFAYKIGQPLRFGLQPAQDVFVYDLLDSRTVEL